MNVAVVGTGYVGLVTGTCLAELGNNVICVDIDHDKVARMHDGQVPIYEPELETYFRRNIKEGRLSFTTDLAQAVAPAEVVFMALPTPEDEDGSADLSYISAAATDLGPVLNGYKVIINKSTVPVGTAEKVKSLIAEKAQVEFDVVSNPEFLREGFAVQDFMKPDRIVVGSSSSRASQLMRQLYEPLTRQGSPLMLMDERSAEMTKYAANSFLATKISFINEIANLCEELGADVDSVRLGIGSDGRIGPRFLFPGIGFGGSCFPKDIRALRHTANQHNSELRILKVVDEVNDRQQQRLVEKVKRYYQNDLKDKHFAIWGLAFKPDTDDIRQAPALTIIESLTAAGAQVTAFDPEARPKVEHHFKGNTSLRFADSMYEAAQSADALLIITEWKEFQSANLSQLKKLLKQSVIFDGRNIYDLSIMQGQGFYYESIGRPVVKPTQP